MSEMALPVEVERWGTYELALEGPQGGNPFLDVRLSAQFGLVGTERVVEVGGFYDGEGVYRVRFMPDTLGTWRYVTQSNCPELDSRTDAFECVAP